MSAAPGPTADAFLGGRVEVLQPQDGHHRSGLEAVLLAAALPAGTSGEVVDLGAGAGAAGFCAAELCADASVLLVERDASLLALADAALERPANARIAGRIRTVAVDVSAPETQRVAAGCPRGTAAAVLMNPPFRAAGAVRPSPQAARAAAHVLPEGLDPWFRTAASMLRPGGLVLAIVAAALVADLLAAATGRFGRAVLLPIHPRAAEPALRILLAARKGSRAAPSILPGLVLHDGPGGGFSPALEAVLRGEAGLAEASPPWRRAIDPR